jgi:hypothetical protein
VRDPAQAWNAVTVGAYTELVSIRDPRLAGWSPLASPGELSPYSTTSVSFGASWPMKPDVVVEGGNIVVNQHGQVDFPVDDLSLLTTNHQPSVRLYESTQSTSAACAQVARLAAMVSAAYPAFWPETVRALVIHSATWTERMYANLGAAGGKRQRAALVRRYGFGVPDLARACRSANDSLTLIKESTISPFVKGRLKEMHVHDLPWPKDALMNLGATQVRLRITLSYFIEPNPARLGWRARHRYQSHGLRFDVKRPAETLETFRKRINQAALDEDETRPRSTGDDEWYLGKQSHDRGSVHSDIWQGTAADLAQRGAIGIYPVTGWWKDQPARDRSDAGARYALVVSIDAPGVDVDLWTPVASRIGVPVVVLT